MNALFLGTAAGALLCAGLAFAEGASAPAAASVQAVAATNAVAAATNAVKAAKVTLCKVSPDVRGPAGDTQFHMDGAGVELVADDGEVEPIPPDEPVTIRAIKYKVRSTSDAYTIDPAELDLTGKADCAAVFQFVRVEE